MNRRKNLKILATGIVGSSLFLPAGCKTEKNQSERSVLLDWNYGRTEEEKIHDSKMLEASFFTDKEKSVLTQLIDIIIPEDEKSPSASQAGVLEFLEFMVKDYPKFQHTLRGGIMWIEQKSEKLFQKKFVDIDAEQKLYVVDLIAFPDQVEDENRHAVPFFNLLRNLTCTGFFTSKIGLEDLGYLGNRPNQWDGIPQEVLDLYGLDYDPKYRNVYLDIKQQQDIVQWAENGDIIG